MRLVLDTVILVRGLMGPRGPQGRLLFELGDQFTWLTSPAIIAEYLDVLYRPALAARFRRLETRHIDIVLQQIADSINVEPRSVPHVCRDPHDDMFLAAALAGSAHAIVSEDHDLLSLGEYEGIRICKAQTMIAALDDAPAEEGTEA